MATVFEDKDIMKGDAKREWTDAGKVLVSAMLDTTRFGKTFGWKAFVKGCHYLPSKGGKTTMAVKAMNEGTRRIDLTVHPKGCNYTFDVDLTTGRTDTPFKDVCEAVAAAIGQMNPLPVVSVSPTVAAAANPKANGPVSPGPVDIAKLMKLRGGIDAVLQVGKDMNELAGLKAEAKLKLQEAEADEGARNTLLVKAQEDLATASDMLKVQKERVEDHDRRLRNAIVDRDFAQQRLEAANTACEEARAEYEPRKKILDSALAEIAELQRMEDEQLKKVGDAKQLANLLAALNQMP